MEDNAQLQSDELTTLTAILGDQVAVDDRGVCLTARQHGTDVEIKLDIRLPENYPSTAPPGYTLVAPHLNGDQKNAIYDRLRRAYECNRGQPVLYEWFQIIQDQLPAMTAAIGQDQPDVGSSQQPRAVPVDVHSGDPLTDRKSTFQAHVATVNSKQDVQRVLDHLKSNGKIARATHNMYAYRIENDDGRRLQDCDDDGESHAGARLLHLLELADVRNALVVVSRWYGGVMLGPDRFKHINNVARELLEQRGYVTARKSHKRR